jgi:nucleoside-diphosphate-sugar epimerase
VRADATPIWKHYVGDLCKEAIKHLIRHPNRKIPSFRDWDCRTQRARYDSSATRHDLGWEPVASREEIVQRGIVDMVRDYLR